MSAVAAARFREEQIVILGASVAGLGAKAPDIEKTFFGSELDWRKVESRLQTP